MIHDIYIIDDKNELISTLRKLFMEKDEYRFINIKNTELDVALKNIPSLIIIDEDNTDIDIIELCQRIRENDTYN